MKPRQIVILDDDSCLTETISSIVSEEGFIPYSFNNGTHLLNELHHLSPDLFLLDIRLPDVNGDFIAKQIRNHPRFKDTPVIFVSANDDLSNISETDNLADAYLSKPFDFDQLLKLINQLTL